jgi:hypothetical protein
VVPAASEAAQRPAGAGAGQSEGVAAGACDVREIGPAGHGIFLQRVLQDALQKDPVTSRADFTRRVLLWADASGRVTRVKLDESKDDAAINRAIDETLTGLQLEEPPPKDMPMPIHLRFTARRPN